MANKNGKKTVWLYAVVLFTSAFIVLLIAGYSQIKFNKNIDEYKSRLNNREQENSKFQMNLSSALAENKRLNEKILGLEYENSKLIKGEYKVKVELNNVKIENQKKIENYEKLLLADVKYVEGDVKSCSLILINEIEKKYLDSNALYKFNNLYKLTFRKAAQEFYNDGHTNYKKGLYENAIEDLNNSLNLSKNEYFSDDCYYFIAYSQLRKGNKFLAKDAMNNLLVYYPESTYKKEAINFIKNNCN